MRNPLRQAKKGLRLPWQCHCCGREVKGIGGLPIPIPPPPTCIVCGEVTCNRCVHRWESLKRGGRVCKDCGAEVRI